MKAKLGEYFMRLILMIVYVIFFLPIYLLIKLIFFVFPRSKEVIGGACRVPIREPETFADRAVLRLLPLLP